MSRVPVRGRLLPQLPPGVFSAAALYAPVRNGISTNGGRAALQEWAFYAGGLCMRGNDRQHWRIGGNAGPKCVAAQAFERGLSL